MTKGSDAPTPEASDKTTLNEHAFPSSGNFERHQTSRRSPRGSGVDRRAEPLAAGRLELRSTGDRQTLDRRGSNPVAR